MRSALLAATCLCALIPLAHAAPDQAAGQLPRTVIPTAYTIAIDANMARTHLTGHETIAVTATAAISRVVMNQAGLTLTRATIDGNPATIAEDQTAQTATLTPTGPLAPGHHTITIDYAGPILATPNGIYYDDYTAPDGKTRRMLVTQFEVADARRMFPGWDEPDFKASFQLTATMPAAYVPVSNMPVAHIVKHGAEQTVAFERSPRMSTYLLALFAGDLGSIHGSGDGIPIGAYAPMGEQNQAAYALHAAEEILPYYDTYFAIKYPLPKLDLIAIPGNYEAGAMENWGAISFIDNALLFNPKTSTQANKENIFIDVSHEMAHQWSGDLVTMKWWDDIWLNEGFATWMENKATDHFNPTWHIWERQHADREAAMAVDALSSTHAIHQPIPDVAAANAAFDLISYQKGSAVIRMIEDWLTPDTFRAGMRAYMRQHAYGNTTDADLWAALSGASGKTVAPVAESFTDQPGIPELHVTRACHGRDAVLTLSQSRFVLNDPSAAKLTWQIPVTIGGPGLTTQRLVLGATPAALKFPGCDAAIKANLGENGYYRTQYGRASLNALERNFTALATIDQTNLLADQYALFEAGTAPLSDYLDLVTRMPQNPGYVEIDDTLTHLAKLDVLLRRSPEQAQFRAFARRLLTPEMTRLGWTKKPGESVLDSLLRPKLIAALGEFNDPETIAIALAKFKDFAKNPQSVAPELRGPIATIAGQHATPQIYATLANLVKNSPDTEQKLRYFEALAGAQDPALMSKSIDLAISGAIPNGRILYALAMIAYGSQHPATAWNLVVPRLHEIESHLAPWSKDRVLPMLLFSSSNTELADKMLAMAKQSGSSGAVIYAKRAAAAVEARAAERARAIPQVSAWLSGRHA